MSISSIEFEKTYFNCEWILKSFMDTIILIVFALIDFALIQLGKVCLISTLACRNFRVISSSFRKKEKEEKTCTSFLLTIQRIFAKRKFHKESMFVDPISFLSSYCSSFPRWEFSSHHRDDYNAGKRFAIVDMLIDCEDIVVSLSIIFLHI